MTPLVSCIMPTYNRRPFIRQSLKYFLAQDYPNKELLIIDDGEDKVADLVPRLENIRYISISEQCSLGMKRNLAVSLAKGEMICHWDDDDYYGPARLSRQVQPLLSETTDASGLTMEVVFDSTTWQAWKCTPILHKEIWAHDVAAGTLMFRRACFDTVAVYPPQSIGEDAEFLHRLLTQDVRLTRLSSARDFLYIRHGDVWPLPPVHHAHMHEWQQVPVEQYLSEEERAFYRQFMLPPSMRSERDE